MRADNDYAVGNSVDSIKDESNKPKPLHCPEEKWEDAEVKISENGKINTDTCELFYDTRTGEEWDKESDLNASARKSCGDSRDNSDDIAAKMDSIEKVDPVFYMDKNVTACDLPEILVCYKENAYHTVKDICVDEGVPVQEKFLFGERDSVKCSSNSSHCESKDLMKAEKVNENPLETKSLEDINSKLDDDPKANQEVEESSKEEFADAEGSSKRDQESLIVTREADDSPVQGLISSEISQEIESEECLKNEVSTSENVFKESLTLGDILSREDEQKQPHIQGNLETELKETEEKLFSVSTTTSQEPNISCNHHERSETDNQQPNLIVEEDGKLLTGGFGETSFSAAEAVSISGHITYSGPIAYSGSLSVRSDASTTSGRSFAFPILQSEWNSSPVRMAKADKRRHKGWRHTLLCCRFS